MDKKKRRRILAYLILVKNLAVVKVSMGEDPIDATANRTQFGHR